MDIHRPPCWRKGQPCPNDCAARLYQRTIYNHTPLHGPWEGWRMTGVLLVSPHREKIDAASLDRHLFRLYRFR